MDLVAAGRDELNDLMLNPDWYGQSGTSHGTSSVLDIDADAECEYFRNGDGVLHTERCSTRKLQVDERRPFHGPFPDLIAYACRFVYDRREQLERGSVHGHVNWDVVTYTGKVYFDDFQDPGISLRHSPGDGDLDFTLVRDDHRGYVKATAVQDHVGHPPGIVLEANRSELGDLDTPWWSQFAGSLHAPDFTDARKRLYGADATAIGLLGIDTKHGSHTELHPLFALFARTDTDRLGEHWIFLARTSGYEGGCSQDEHFLGRNAIRMAITAPAPAKMFNLAVSPRSAASWISPQPGEDVHVLTVRFPPAVRRAVVVGEFDLCETPCAPGRHARPPAPAVSESDRQRERSGTEEASLEPLMAMLTDKQRATFRRLVETAPYRESPQRLYNAFETAAGGAAQARAILKLQK